MAFRIKSIIISLRTAIINVCWDIACERLVSRYGLPGGIKDFHLRNTTGNKDWHDFRRDFAPNRQNG